VSGSKSKVPPFGNFTFLKSYNNQIRKERKKEKKRKKEEEKKRKRKKERLKRKRNDKEKDCSLTY
jgi:hypothetical protein